MEIQLTQTSKIVSLNGVPARIWEGVTSSGIPIHAFITRIAVNKDEDCGQFEAELQQEIPPSTDVASYPLFLLI